MRVILKAALIGAGLALAAIQASARDLEIYGTSEGQRAHDECPPGQYFVGVVGNAGLWIDQITVACATLKPDLTLSAAPPSPLEEAVEEPTSRPFAAPTSLLPQWKSSAPPITRYSQSSRRVDRSRHGPQGRSISTVTADTEVGAADETDAVHILSNKPPAAVAAACQPGIVWRESFEGDALCVKPDERFRKADGTCRAGYVWRDLFNGDGVCVTPKDKKKAWVAAGKPLPGSQSGADGAFVKMIPTTADKFVSVDQEVDVYRAPGGNDADKTGTT